MLYISSRKVTQTLLYTVIGLSCLSLLEWEIGLSDVFNVGSDTSVPTWYSSFALLLSGFLLTFIAFNKNVLRDRYARHWTVLSAIFYGLSIDEVAMIHERVGDVVNRLPGREQLVDFLSVFPAMEGIFGYAWVLVGIPFACICALLYLRFILHLPPRIRLLFVMAGSIFLAGAIGVESLAAQQDYWYGMNNRTYHLITAVEEFLEMLGVVVFIHGLFLYINTYLGEVHVVIGEEPSSFSYKPKRTFRQGDLPSALADPRQTDSQSSN